MNNRTPFLERYPVLLPLIVLVAWLAVGIAEGLGY